MKKFLSILLLLASIAATAQTQNFGVNENSKVYWQKVFDSSYGAAQVADILNNDGRFVDIVNNGGLVTCKVSEAFIDYKSFGYSSGTAPMYIVNSNISFFATVQVKEGRYRVTVENIVFTVASDAGIFKKGDRTAMESYAMKKDGLKGAFLTGSADILNKYFEDLFTLREKSILNDDW